MSRAEHYRRKAEECFRKAEREPEPQRADLEKLARQWARLAEYAEAESSEFSDDMDIAALASRSVPDPSGPQH